MAVKGPAQAGPEIFWVSSHNDHFEPGARTGNETREGAKKDQRMPNGAATVPPQCRRVTKDARRPKNFVSACLHCTGQQDAENLRTGNPEAAEGYQMERNDAKSVAVSD